MHRLPQNILLQEQKKHALLLYDKLKSRRRGALPLPSFVPVENDDEKERGGHDAPPWFSDFVLARRGGGVRV